jgi:uncharacterized protein YdiU (UPF0061 family)
MEPLPQAVTTRSTPYRPDPRLLALASWLGDPVEAADFPETRLRFRNDRAAAQVGLESLTPAEWIAHFGRFVPLPDNFPQPLALRYHGHQFGSYNPELGDGRGFTFAQLRDAHGRLMDLGTKGSGQTPWSRRGDGRLTLKGAVREILATEMLEALGVNTSRTFSVIETGESLWRGDEPSPTRSAVLVRLSHGHIRIGTFQRLLALDKPEEMHALIAYALENFPASPDTAPTGLSPAATLLHHVVARMADMAASYTVAGFVHGVLNTDNMNITGESFDYGPWRWLPRWDAGFTAAYFDHAGRYAFGRQAEAIGWNCGQMAVALRLVEEAPPLIAALDRFVPLYKAALARRWCWRLGWSRATRRPTPPSSKPRRTPCARRTSAPTPSSSPSAARPRCPPLPLRARGRHPSLVARGNPAKPADRGSRSDMGSDCRTRRLEPAGRQSRRDPHHGRGAGSRPAAPGTGLDTGLDSGNRIVIDWTLFPNGLLTHS